MSRFLALALAGVFVVGCTTQPAASPPRLSASNASRVPVRRASLTSSTAENSCTIGFASPGEECGDHGECPETVHRSLLWGLIEYDTDVTICFCLIECEIDW